MQTAVPDDTVVPLLRQHLGTDALGVFGRLWFELSDACDGVPARTAFDPVRIVSLLPYMIVVESLGHDDFRYRLLGTGVDHFTRAPYAGKRTSELDGHGPGNRIHHLFTAALETGGPVGTMMPYVGVRSVCSAVRQIAAPFRGDRGGDQVISVLTFELRAGVNPAALKPDQRQVL